MVAPRGCKILLVVAWPDTKLPVVGSKPCADYFCPEGQDKHLPATAVIKCYSNPFVQSLLRLCNDVETNPGPNPNSPVKRRSNSRRGAASERQQQQPPRQRSRAPNFSDEDASDSGEQRGRGRSRLSRNGAALKDDKKYPESKHDNLQEKVLSIEEQMATVQTAVAHAENTAKMVDHLTSKVSQIDGIVSNSDSGLLRENSKLRDEISYLVKTCKAYESRLVDMETEVQGIKTQMNELVCVYDDLQDRLYDIDRSWQNNLVFHGIKPDPGGVHESMDCLEAKVKSVLRTTLNIGRDIPIVRIQRIFNGSDVRGYKPVVVNFQKWSDKEDVLRKSKILKTSAIYVEEDFSRAAKFRRKELEKFAKEIKALSPDKKCIFKHDKLIIDDHVYIYNDQEHRIERLPSTLSSGLDEETGDAVTLSRRLRLKQQMASSTTTNGGNSKRAQSVESMLDRIPSVVGNHHSSDHHYGGHQQVQGLLTSSVSSFNVNSQATHQSSPERRSKQRALAEVDQDSTDMDVGTGDEANNSQRSN